MRLVDLALARRRLGLEQRHRRHDLARLAVAALRHAQFHPGLLHDAADAVVLHVLDGVHWPCPLTADAGVMHDRVGWPSTCTVQAPHRPCRSRTWCRSFRTRRAGPTGAAFRRVNSSFETGR
jgi:hypothetical protein